MSTPVPGYGCGLARDARRRGGIEEKSSRLASLDQALDIPEGVFSAFLNCCADQRFEGTHHKVKFGNLEREGDVGGRLRQSGVI